jgi:transcriptional regulator with XRE-family HTH domain
MATSDIHYDWEQISRNVRLMRKLLKTTQLELAERAQVQRSSIQRLESGLSVRVSTLKKVCAGLQVNFDEIAGMRRPFGPDDRSGCVAHSPERQTWYRQGDRRPRIPEDNESRIQAENERFRLGSLGLVPRFRSYLDFVLMDGPGVFFVEVYDRYEDWHETGEEGVYKDWILYCLRGSVRLRTETDSQVLSTGGAIGFKSGFSFSLEPLTPAGTAEEVPKLMFIGANRRE